MLMETLSIRGSAQHEASAVGTAATKPGRGPAAPEPAASRAAAGLGRARGAACGPRELGRVGRGPPAG